MQCAGKVYQICGLTTQNEAFDNQGFCQSHERTTNHILIPEAYAMQSHPLSRTCFDH